MKIWTSEHIFNHSWDTVVKAAWRKYPNPMNPSVIGTDIIDRKVIDGVLHTHRIVTSECRLPYWALNIIGNDHCVCYASEKSQVNLSEKRMQLQTRNLTFGSLVAVDEQLTYEPHPSDTSKTLLRQEATVTVRGVPLCGYVEQFLTDKISYNASKGRQAIEWVIEKVESEMKEIKYTAIKGADDILTQTKKSLDGLAFNAKRSIDDITKGSPDDYNLI